MTPRQAMKAMRKAFAALTQTQRKRLRAHAKAKTSICYGAEAGFWQAYSEHDGRNRC